jgi:hypothetical protein
VGFSTAPATRFQPAVVDGRLDVGTGDGRLVMLELNDPTADGWSPWGGGPTHNGRQADVADARLDKAPPQRLLTQH